MVTRSALRYHFHRKRLSMTEIEFNALAAKGYNRIPIIAETYADLDTPLSIYLKLAYNGPEGGRYSCLMESVLSGERFGRYSFIGLPAHTFIRATGNHTEVVQDGQVIETHEGNPLDFIEAYQARFKVALLPGMPRFRSEERRVGKESSCGWRRWL